jgi:uroporphyrin-III C-methyltransferase
MEAKASSTSLNRAACHRGPTVRRAARETSLSGLVVLVGAGPGDPELITRKGLRWLRLADVVVHDRLVSGELLDEAPPAAERIDAGKAPGRHALSQDQIHAVMIARASAGKIVVRLKGGDPCVFGRAGEELEALRAAGIRVEIVPGVTALTAAAACAGFSLTHRGRASTVLLATGSEAAGGGDSRQGPLGGWPQLGVSGETLVFYMPVRNLVTIAATLLDRGLPPDEPALLVQGVSTSRERQLFAPLAQIAMRSRDLELQAPAILVVGAAVAAAPEWRLTMVTETPHTGPLAATPAAGCRP